MKNHNQLQKRCPRLGGEVLFSYCASEGGEIPCPKIITCWQGIFDVESYLKKYISHESWERFSAQGTKDKLSTILELVEAAKKRTKSDAQE
jgi:hypothetical protein